MKSVWTLAAAFFCAAALPDFSPDAAEAVASVPPQCEIQRLSWCIPTIEEEIRLVPLAEGATAFELPGGIGTRRHRIVEPWRCRERSADVIPPYPDTAAVRRDDDGWLRFVLRLRADGSCDLEIAQQVPAEHRGTRYDRVMWIPVMICLGEAQPAYPGHREAMPEEWARLGTACLLRY